MWAAFTGIAGLVILAFGLLGILTFFMPKFGGGSNETGILVFGLIISGAGLALIFYAGILLRTPSSAHHGRGATASGHVGHHTGETEMIDYTATKSARSATSPDASTSEKGTP